MKNANVMTSLAAALAAALGTLLLSGSGAAQKEPATGAMMPMPPGMMAPVPGQIPGSALMPDNPNLIQDAQYVWAAQGSVVYRIDKKSLAVSPAPLPRAMMAPIKK